MALPFRTLSAGVWIASKQGRIRRSLSNPCIWGFDDLIKGTTGKTFFFHEGFVFLETAKVVMNDTSFSAFQ